MKSMRYLVLVILTGVAENLRWRCASRHHSWHCPIWLVCWIFDGSLGNQLLGRQSALRRIGVNQGQRVLEVWLRPKSL